VRTAKSGNLFQVKGIERGFLSPAPFPLPLGEFFHKTKGETAQTIQHFGIIYSRVGKPR
jgi:hypothetical protein